MKTILVDAIYAFVLADGTIFQAMYDMLETFPNRKILLTGSSALTGMPYEIFTLHQNPPKSNPEYYQKMFAHFGLKNDDVLYFEQNKQAVESARSVGIKTYYYDPVKKDLVALKKFLVQS